MKSILLPVAALSAWIAGAVTTVWLWDRLAGYLWLSHGWHPAGAVLLGLAGIVATLALLFVAITFIYELLED